MLAGCMPCQQSSKFKLLIVTPYSDFCPIVQSIIPCRVTTSGTKNHQEPPQTGCGKFTEYLLSLGPKVTVGPKYLWLYGQRLYVCSHNNCADMTWNF